MKKLSTLLQEYRCERRLSVNKLSKLTGISRRTLARIEMGYSEREPARRGEFTRPLINTPANGVYSETE